MSGASDTQLGHQVAQKPINVGLPITESLETLAPDESSTENEGSACEFPEDPPDVADPDPFAEDELPGLCERA